MFKLTDDLTKNSKEEPDTIPYIYDVCSRRTTTSFHFLEIFFLKCYTFYTKSIKMKNVCR